MAAAQSSFWEQNASTIVPKMPPAGRRLSWRQWAGYVALGVRNAVPAASTRWNERGELEVQWRDRAVFLVDDRGVWWTMIADGQGRRAWTFDEGRHDARSATIAIRNVAGRFDPRLSVE